ncbi:hypothetical protein V491_07759 [Pseudogymnoascus sp. VKM F-3775]|nr:hypothetical protein V491_07759 [Pseudogymnoascus sp. VKM F-3775]
MLSADQGKDSPNISSAVDPGHGARPIAANRVTKRRPSRGRLSRDPIIVPPLVKDSVVSTLGKDIKPVAA